MLRIPGGVQQKL